MVYAKSSKTACTNDVSKISVRKLVEPDARIQKAEFEEQGLKSVQEIWSQLFNDRWNEMQRTSENHESRKNVNPDDLRFTKGTINLNFPGQLEYGNIYDVLDALENKKLIPRDLPSLRVVSHVSQIWTLDNKLLYIYRISPKVKRISVVYVSGTRVVDKFVNENSELDIERMASAEFFPEVINFDEPPDASCPAALSVPLQIDNGCKNSDTEKTNASMSSTTKSSSMISASSSTTVASRISSEEITRAEVPLPVLRSKGVFPVRKMKSRPTSSTNSSLISSEDTVEVKNCYPAIRSMTGQLNSYEEVRKASSRTLSPQKPRPAKFCERPSTSQESSGVSSRFSHKSFASATRARSGKTLETLTRLDHPGPVPGPVFPKNSKTNRMFPLRNCDLGPATRSYSISSIGTLACQSDASLTLPQPHNSANTSITAEPDTSELLEAFVLPDFCYPQKISIENLLNAPLDEEGAPLTNDPLNCTQKPLNATQRSSEVRLDRSVSSCSSSTERPMLRQFPQNSGLGRFVKRSGSNLRASVFAGRPLKCQLSADHEFEVSKKILLKHMKKAFFSVY